jgi:transposase-like protein
MKSIANASSEAKIQAQVRRKLFNSHIRCPRCSRRYSRKLSDRYFCGKCRYKFSLKSCLVFKGSKLSFSRLWQLLECWLGRLSISQASFVSGLSEPTVRRWYRKFSGLIPEEQAGLSGIVEVDEAFIGKRKYHNQTVVVGALERGTGKIALRALSGRLQGETDRFILDTITKESLIHTDAWTGYWHLTEFFGYAHEMVNHDAGGFGPTNRIENVWMRLRRFIRKTVARAWKEHLPRLLKEFQARVNHLEAFRSPLSFLSFVPSQLG